MVGEHGGVAMQCPHCGSREDCIKKGSFQRKTGLSATVARFYCKRCRRNASTQTGTVAAGHRRPELNRPVYLLLGSGVSQRRTARLLGTTQTTIARKLV